MSVRSLSALAAASLLLAGCGFTPLYGDAGGSLSLSRIAVTTQDDRLGYRLREQLEDALGWNRNAAPLYRLETVVQQNRRPLGRRIDDTATRYELTVRGAWTLTPVAGGADPGVRPRQEAVHLGPLDQDHCADRARIRSTRISRASSAAARSSPSCWAAMAA